MKAIDGAKADSGKSKHIEEETCEKPSKFQFKRDLIELIRKKL